MRRRFLLAIVIACLGCVEGQKPTPLKRQENVSTKPAELRTKEAVAPAPEQKNK